MDRLHILPASIPALLAAYPGGGYEICDEADGLGPYLRNWTRPEPEPTAAELAALSAPAFPVPATISNFQARRVLKAAGLFAAVEAAVLASSDEVLKDAWEYGGGFDRDSPALNALASGLGLSPAQVDDLFRQAAGIRA